MILRSRSSPRRSLLLPALAQAKEDKTIPPAASTPNIPLTVLVVDDDRNQVEILTRFLSRRGMRALPAYGGQQCLEMVCQRSIDVIVLDVVIPGMGGLVVCAALKKRAATRSIPIILLTARDDAETRLEALRLGVSEFVAKPARGQDLLASIRTQVESSRKACERRRVQTGRKPPKAKK